MDPHAEFPGDKIISGFLGPLPGPPSRIPNLPIVTWVQKRLSSLNKWSAFPVMPLTAVPLFAQGITRAAPNSGSGMLAGTMIHHDVFLAATLPAPNPENEISIGLVTPTTSSVPGPKYQHVYPAGPHPPCRRRLGWAGRCGSLVCKG